MQTLIFGLSQGAIYALMALAIGIVNSTTQIINFAHGSVIMLGAMVSYWMIAVYHFPYWAGLLIGVAVNMVVNALIYKLSVEKLGDLTKNMNWIISLFGMSIIINNVARMIFGTEPLAYPYLFQGVYVSFLGANVMVHELIMIGSAIVIGVVYEFICRKTNFGRALRAVAYKPETSKLMGIHSNRIGIACFAIAGAVAAWAGALIAPIVFASYSMTATIEIKGFAAAVLGGLGDTKGAFVGGFMLGITESIVTLFLPSSIKDAISFIIMIVVLIFLPGGMLSAKIFSRGRSTAEKV
jgi:branched-chain amino acid transport system permease protein